MKLDDFDAVFRSSVKDRFRLEPIELGSIMLLTDLPEDEATALEATVKQFLSASLALDELSWRTVREGEYGRVRELLDLIEREAPDLIVSYRHLLGRDKDLLHSLGSFIDTVTQVTSQPVLLLPPLSHDAFEQRMAGINKVLVVTDHIVGDQQLVNWGVCVCPDQGTIVLAHVEDDSIYQRYMNIISMVPDVNTDTAARRITDKLLGRPRDYIQSTIEALEKAEIQETVVPVVTMGHLLSDYRKIIDEHDIDLIVFNTKDENQLAMDGMAYAISIEIQDRPLLML